jgi:hypothetical protein
LTLFDAAFHSCVGGCHGCFNNEQGDNKGLQKISDIVEKFYQQNGLQAEG